MVSDSCKAFNSFNGKCTSCYSGYTLDNNGKCPESNLTVQCAITEPNTGVCTRCYNGSFLDASSICQPIDPNCQSFNYQTRRCESCYKGYSVTKAGGCEVQAVVTASIPNCVEYDSNQNCLKCYNFYYLSSNSCVAVNPLCKTYDSTNGNCLSCYSIFKLKDGQCALPWSINPIYNKAFPLFKYHIWRARLECGYSSVSMTPKIRNLSIKLCWRWEGFWLRKGPLRISILCWHLMAGYG